VSYKAWAHHGGRVDASSIFPSLLRFECMPREQLSKCTVVSINRKRPQRTVMISLLSGIVYYLERTLHFDGFNAA
jgi:hypothetical protein